VGLASKIKIRKYSILKSSWFHPKDYLQLFSQIPIVGWIKFNLSS